MNLAGLLLIKLSSKNKVSFVQVSSCSNTGSIRDDPYKTSEKIFNDSILYLRVIKGDFGLNGYSKRRLFSSSTTFANRSLMVKGSLGATFCPVLPLRSSSEGMGVVGNGGGTSGDVACDEDAAWDALRNDSGIRGDTDPSRRLIFVSVIVLFTNIPECSEVSSTELSIDTLKRSVFLFFPNMDISMLSCFVTEIRGEILFDTVLPGLIGIFDLSEMLPKSRNETVKLR